MANIAPYFFPETLICFIDIDRNIIVSATKSETDYYRFHTYGFLCAEFGTQEEVHRLTTKSHNNEFPFSFFTQFDQPLFSIVYDPFLKGSSTST